MTPRIEPSREDLIEIGFPWTLVLARPGRKGGIRYVPLREEELAFVQNWRPE